MWTGEGVFGPGSILFKHSIPEGRPKEPNGWFQVDGCAGRGSADSRHWIPKGYGLKVRSVVARWLDEMFGFEGMLGYYEQGSSPAFLVQARVKSLRLQDVGMWRLKYVDLFRRKRFSERIDIDELERWMFNDRYENAWTVDSGQRM
jgi:hypothetical protein